MFLEHTLLTRDQLLKEYPLMIGYVPGQAPDDTFTYCEDICLIELKGCITACISDDTQNLLTTYNAVHLHSVGTKFHYKLFVNSSSPGYAAFIEELNLRVASCSLPATFGSSVPASQAVDLVDMQLAGADTAGNFTGCTSADGIITNGVIELYWSVPTPAGSVLNVTDIIAAINSVIASSTAATGNAWEIDTSVGAASVFAGTNTIITVNCK
jgi:hypothetical protein